MKAKLNLIQTCLLGALMLTLPAAVQAQQFSYATSGGTATIVSYIGTTGGAVTIPSTHNGFPVTSIGDNAFNSAFYNSGNVTSVTIPDSITNIGNYAFNLCINLTSVTIGNSVAIIGNGAFYGCSSLTNILIPNSVTTIGVDVFYYCSKLKHATIGSSVTRIAPTMFYGCSSLYNVTIPSSVTNIAYEAFAGDTSLYSIYFQGNSPSLGANVFPSFNITVYYLPGTTNWGATFGGLPTVLWNPQALTSGTSFGVRTNRFGFKITGTSGLDFVVEACTNFVNPVWQPVQTNTLTNGSAYFSDPQWTNHPGRFYRLRSP